MNRRRFHPLACTYREYLTDDARLVLATLRSCRRPRAQSILNYARLVTPFEQVEDRVHLDIRSPPSTVSQAQFTGAGAVCWSMRQVPWVEAVQAAGGGPTPDSGQSQRLHLSKGVHIALDLGLSCR